MDHMERISCPGKPHLSHENLFPQPTLDMLRILLSPRIRSQSIFEQRVIFRSEASDRLSEAMQKHLPAKHATTETQQTEMADLQTD